MMIVRHAFAFEAEHLATVGAFRDGHIDGATWQVYLCFATQQGHVEVYRGIGINILPFQFKAAVCRHLDGNEQVSRLATTAAFLALAFEADHLAVLQAGFQFDAQAGTIYFHLAAATFVGILQAYFHGGIQVIALLRAPCLLPAATSAASKTLSKQGFKEVRELAAFFLATPEVVIVRMASAIGIATKIAPVKILRAPATLLVVLPVGPKLVVFLAFFGIAEHFVSLIGFLELFLRGLVTRVFIGVILFSHFAVGFLYFVVGSGLLNAQDFIVVFYVHKVVLNGPFYREIGPAKHYNSYAGEGAPAKMSGLPSYPFRLNAGSAFSSHKSCIFTVKLSTSTKIVCPCQFVLYFSLTINKMNPLTPDLIETVKDFTGFFTELSNSLQQPIPDHHLSSTELTVLQAISQQDNCRSSTLIQQLRIDPGYLSRMLKSFETEQLVSRRKVPNDARTQYIQLTGKGKKLLVVAAAHLDLQVANLLKPVPEAHHGHLVSAMHTIQDVFRQKGGNMEPDVQHDIVFRHSLEPGDLGYLIYLHGSVLGPELGYNQSYEPHVIKEFNDFLQTYNPVKDRIWLATYKGQIIGAAAILAQSRHLAQLRWFFVHPEHRGKGVDMHIMQDVLAFCKDKLYQKINVFTTNEQPAMTELLENVGFKKSGEKYTQLFGKYVYEQRFDKDHYWS